MKLYQVLAIAAFFVCLAPAPEVIAQVIPESEQPVPLKSSGFVAAESISGGDTDDPPLPPMMTVNISTLFEGFGFDDNATENGGFRFIPPDPMGAAGIDRLIATVNTMIEIRDKAGVQLARDSLADFFAPLAPTTFTFDPKVIWDQFENRFLVVTLERVDAGVNPDAGNASRILLAVSTGPSPTLAAADWNFLLINSETSIGGVDHWADYPGFEVDEEAVYITNNMFAHPGGVTNFTVQLWIVGKGVGGGFYAGGPAAVSVNDVYAGGGSATTTMPAQVFGAGGVGAGIGTFLVSAGLSGGGDEFVQIVRVDDPLGAPTFTQEFLNIGNIDNGGALPDAPQSGTGTLIEVNDRRALDCVWRNNNLWLTNTINPNSGPDLGETTAHWFRLDTSAVLTSAAPAGAITLADQGDIGGEDIAADTSTFFASVAVNGAGEAKFGFSASAATIFAGAYVTGRQPGDAAGTVQPTETVKAGEAFYIRTFGGPRNRWGDYSGISVDPINDDLFWVFNEFADTRAFFPDAQGFDGRWGTAWASCTFAGEGTPVDVYLVVDLSGSFGDDLPNFKAAAPTLIADLLASNPNTKVGLADFHDYPISPFGSAAAGDVAYERLVDLTFDTDTLLATIAGLTTRSGADGPQSQLPALFQTATGAGQDLAGDGFPGATIPAGQQANFRIGAEKLIILWTDAPFHRPGDPGDIPYPGPSFDDTVAAILALDPPKVVCVYSGSTTSTFGMKGLQDCKDMATATFAVAPAGGVDCDDNGTIDLLEGEPLVCPILTTGEGIAEAIIALVEAATQPVADAGPDQTVECTSPAGTPVTLDGSGSSDPDGAPLTFEWSGPFPEGGGLVTGVSPIVTLALGAHTITLTVEDVGGGTDSDMVEITVQDTTQPALTLSTTLIEVPLPTATATGATVDLSSVAVATDTCDSSVAISNDAPGTFPLGFTLVTFTATDDSGNARQATLTVHVGYVFTGFFKPINIDGSSVFKGGRVVPIKFELSAGDGSVVSDATPALEVFKVSNSVLGSVEVDSAGESNEDNSFRFDPDKSQYIYNLSTKGWSAGTYLFRVHLGDETSREVQASIR